MKITLYELRNLSNGKPEGYAAALNGEMLPDVNPSPEATLQVAEDHAFGQMPRGDVVDGQPVDVLATDEPHVNSAAAAPTALDGTPLGFPFCERHRTFHYEQGCEDYDRAVRRPPHMEHAECIHRSIYDRHIGQVRERRVALADLTKEILSEFIYNGHPGHKCLRTGWVPVEQLQKWQIALEDLDPRKS